VTADDLDFVPDPLAGEQADRPHVGLNVAIAWPLPIPRASYETLASRLRALDPALYVYPFAYTHVTLLTAVSFKTNPDPSPSTVQAVEDAAATLGDFLHGATRDIAPFTIDIAPAVLMPAAAFLPIANPTGEIALVRKRALEFCASSGGVIAGAFAPRAIHSTIMRFRAPPRDPAAFARAFDEVAADFCFGEGTIDRVLVTLETKPYMREGRILRSAPLERTSA
jgi:hypothetical protein